jgi:hypothetical protein
MNDVRVNVEFLILVQGLAQRAKKAMEHYTPWDLVCLTSEQLSYACDHSFQS